MYLYTCVLCVYVSARVSGYVRPYVYMYLCVCIRMYVYPCRVCTSMYVCKNTWECQYVYVNIHTGVCTSGSFYTHLYCVECVYMCTCEYV